MTTQFSIKAAGGTYYITWPSRPINHNIYKKIVKWILAEHDYGPNTATRQRRLARAVEHIAAEETPLDDTATTAGPPSPSQAAAIRNIVIKNKIIKGYGRMNAAIGRISAEYRAGNGILALAAAHDHPPLALLRGILLRLGYNPTLLHSIFANKAPAEGGLRARDLAQYKAAEANDAESTFNQQLTAEIAAANELAVVGFFRTAGIRLRTQDDLAAEQMQEHGRAVNTPDILFVDKVIINGQPCAWIDYKDYIGTEIKFLYNSNCKQAARYVDEWGQGALAYHMSFIEGMSVPGVILLDAGALPVRLQLA